MVRILFEGKLRCNHVLTFTLWGFDWSRTVASVCRLGPLGHLYFSYSTSLNEDKVVIVPNVKSSVAFVKDYYLLMWEDEVEEGWLFPHWISFYLQCLADADLSAGMGMDGYLNKLT